MASELSDWQLAAISEPALIAEECMRPVFARRVARGTLVLTVNIGYE